MNTLLSGRVVVVTGGAGRIGRAFCTAIARAGGTAVIADTALPAANALATELCEAHGPRAAHACAFDITRAPEIDAAIAALRTRFGRIDAVVNNAYPRNAAYGAKVEDVSFENFVDNVGRHVGGYFLTAQRFARHFEDQGRGNIVFMGSIYGVVAPRFEIYDDTAMTMPVEYSVIKAGLIHLTRYLAQYYKRRGIRVNALSPGGVFADQPASFVQKYSAHSANGQMLAADDLSGALVFLLSDLSAHMTGQNLVVDDGWIL